MENDNTNGKKSGEEQKQKKRLMLRRETLRKLDDRALANVLGGAMEPTDDMGDAKKPKKL